MLLLHHKTLKGSRNLQGFALKGVVLFHIKLFQFFSVHYVTTERFFASLFVEMIERIYEYQNFADFFAITVIITITISQ